jgi:transcription elongation factor GreA
VRLSVKDLSREGRFQGISFDLRAGEVQRPEALEFGDLRENSEYKAALERQNMVKARIVELRQRISEIASIDPNKVPRDRASYGSTLVLYDAEKDEEVTYRLVSPEESDPANGMISTTSPVGKSLMNKQEGDEVVVRTPASTRRPPVMRCTSESSTRRIERTVPSTRCVASLRSSL